MRWCGTAVNCMQLQGRIGELSDTFTANDGLWARIRPASESATIVFDVPYMYSAPRGSAPSPGRPQFRHRAGARARSAGARSPLGHAQLMAAAMGRERKLR